MKKILAALIALTALVALTACSEEPKADSHEEGQKLTEEAFDAQSKAVPYPVKDLKDTVERRNLRERLLRFNEPDKIGYVYIISFGKFLGYYTIEGKISSTQSQMTPSDLVIKADFGEGWESQVVEAPGDDGSYGPNEDGAFFFTTEGVMVQTSSEYIYSDAPLAVANVPELNGAVE